MLDTPTPYIEGTVASVVSDTRLQLEVAPGIVTNTANHYVDTKINVRADGDFLHRPFDGGVEITAGTSPDSSVVRQTRKYFRYQSGKGIQCSVAINFTTLLDLHRLQLVVEVLLLSQQSIHITLLLVIK